ncbi:MAG: HD domain-containing protein [Candidatus Cloacimonetes bacterium]|nr:HD domain-containing protein [Candidatus Cloacimonadota bacterium]
MEIPKQVQTAIKKLQKNGFEAYVVGGCVRDLLRNVEPNDWDMTTNADPKQISKIFPKNFTNNDFGTVAIITGSKKPNLKEIEITPYRVESKYTDKRHPDKISWAKTIDQDLSRRDFTVNAIALAISEKSKVRNPIRQLADETNSKFKIQNSKFTLIDPFKGRKDLKNKIIRTVGKPEHRFSEDALRLMRAVRFSVALGKDWKIEKNTQKAIKQNAGFLQMISKERIRDELIKIIMCERANDGIELLRGLGLLKYIIPELEEGYKVGQNKHHIYDCYKHNLLSLKYAAEQNYNIYVRISALLHDIGKPRTKKGQGLDSTFYGHEIVGARMTTKILSSLRFSKKDIEKITKLVRYHLFYYDVDEVGESSIRRLVRKVGPEYMKELLQVRYCDRIGSGCPKAEPYKLRHLKYMIEKTAQDPISVITLKVSGNDVMKILKIDPGPKIGQVLNILLSQVLDDPKNNKKKDLKEKIKELGKLTDQELKNLAIKAKAGRNRIITKRDEMTKEKYWVK